MKLGYFKGKFFLLLVALLLIFVIYPLFDNNIAQLIHLNILITIILLVGIYAVSKNRRYFFLALSLALPILFAGYMSHFFVHGTLILIGLSFGVIFFSFTATTILGAILSSEDVTRDTIFGSICVYLLFGVIWALLYSITEVVLPGSFAIGPFSNLHYGEPFIPKGFTPVDFSHFVYYSFVTLTTLGYGDIVAVTNPARTLSMLEAIVGQLYLVVLVTRLVGMHIAQRGTEKKSTH